MFYDRVNNLCKSRGTSITAVAKALGLSTATGTNWKSGKLPSIEIAKKFADYLGVSVDYLISDSKDTQQKQLTDNERALLDVYKNLDENLQRQIFGFASDLMDYVQIAKDLHDAGISKKEIEMFIESHTKK